MLWLGCVALLAVGAALVATGGSLPGSSPSATLATLALSGVGILIVVGATKALVTRVPAEHLTLPSAKALAHWSAPENRPTFTRMVRADLDLLAGATLLLLATVFAAEAAGVNDLSLPISAMYTIGVVACVGYMALGARYRVPAQHADTRS